jgi:hypothetical protein
MWTAGQPVLTSNIEGLSGAFYNMTDTGTSFLDRVTRRNRVNSQEFILGNTYDLRDPRQQLLSEEQTMQNAELNKFGREQQLNVVQPMYEAVKVSFMQMSNFNTLDGVNLANQTPTITDELNHQITTLLLQMRLDLNFTLLNGTYEFTRRNSTTPIGTRGILNAIDTNYIAAPGAELTMDLINEALMVAKSNGTQTQRLEIWVNESMLTPLTNLMMSVPGFALPDTRTVAGASAQQILTHYGLLGIYTDTMIPDGVISILDMSTNGIAEKHFMPAHANAQSKDYSLIYVPTPVTVAAVGGFIYGEIGMDYGPEHLHILIDLREEEETGG